MSLSVIIPSRNADNLRACIAAVRKHEPEARIIAVDDGIDWSGHCDMTVSLWVARVTVFGHSDVSIFCGARPFIFARNCNIGIRAAGEDDCVLLNDDALLESPGGFSLMQTEARLHPEVGIIGATTNLTGFPEQWRKIAGLRVVMQFAFVCVFIPRRTINLVGLLDERFTAYGSEDLDYCRRLREAGLLCAVHDGCFVEHGKLQPTFRASPTAGGDISEGQRIYREKWGDLK